MKRRAQTHNSPGHLVWGKGPTYFKSITTMSKQSTVTNNSSDDLRTTGYQYMLLKQSVLCYVSIKYSGLN